MIGGDLSISPHYVRVMWSLLGVAHGAVPRDTSSYTSVAMSASTDLLNQNLFRGYLWTFTRARYWELEGPLETKNKIQNKL